MSNFIPDFHFDPPSSKLTPEWCMKVIGYHYYNSNNRSLLFKKNIHEIEEYAKGDFNLLPFKTALFKSVRHALRNAPRNPDGEIDRDFLYKNDTTGLDITCLPLIPTKLNSAISTVQKVPVEVTCKALDGLAMSKKNEDITFLKNKPLIESNLQELSDKMGLGKIDLGTTEHSSVKFSDAPMGLDLNQPDEEDVFSKILYSLKVETAFEKALQQVYEFKKGVQVRLLETIDQFKFGVSCNHAYNSAITGLPELDYVFPDDMSTPHSDLPDYSDNTHRILSRSVTVMELFNYFANEICDQDTLEQVINGKKTQDSRGGYCACNGKSYVDSRQWNTFRVNLKYVEVKSIDYVGIAKKKRSKRGDVFYFTENADECVDKVWGQNTYGFWWLVNTDYCFGIHRLDYTHRTKGNECYQNFSTNIYKSQKKSAVELSIGDNKLAQIAWIKLHHLIMKSLPPGKYIDLRFLRNALTGLKEEDNQYTIQQLVNLALEQNVFIGDTEGFDGKNDGQMKPFTEIIGGLKMQEAQGYLITIATCLQNIGIHTGINEQLTGEAANPEGLVGMQKLLINSSINALYYCTDAIKLQYQNVFNNWGSLIQLAIKEGGKTRQAVFDMIGADDGSLLEGLKDSPMHRLTIKVDISQREEERQEYRNKLKMLVEAGILSSVDEYLLSGVSNPKERFAIMAMIEKRRKQEVDKKRQEDYINQQSLMKQKGQNDAEVEKQSGQNDIQKEYAKGDVQANLLKLGNQLGLNKTQLDAIIKRSLQRDRIDGQTQKGIKTIQAKEDLKRQQAFQ